MSYQALTARVAEAEHRDEIDGLRRCYDGLLAEYPLSYGHWKCYADHELRHGGAERAAEVYERGVAAVGTCVELWSFYAAFAVSQWNGQPARVRALFERAAGAVGDDYAADALWDRYIAFEMPRADASATPDHGAVGALYRRVLRLPLRALDMYRARLAQLASACTAAELLDGAAEAELHAELARHGAAPPLPASAAAEGDDEGARKLRVLPLLEARCALTRSLHAERLRLEGEIRRRHWHVKPLDDEQRQRWRALLEWEEARQLPATTTNGDGGVAGASNGAGGAGHGDGDGDGDGDAAELEAAAVRSYERCLVPCSDDAELWLRYAAFLEGRGKLDAARAVLARASGGVLLRGQVAPTLAHAAFEEAHGDHAAAEALLERAWSASTSAAASASASLEVCLARANLARRRADPSGARAAYRQGLVALRGDALAFLAQHAAHFERRCGGGSGAEGAEAAVALVEAALAREPTSARLIDLRLRLEIDAAAAAAAAPAAAAGGVRHVHDLFERLLAAPCELPAQLQAQLRTRWLAFADEHATSVADVRALEARLRAAATAAAARAAGVKRRRDADSDACAAAAAAAAPAAAPPPPPPPPSWDAYAYQQYGQQQYAIYAQAPQPHWYGAPDAYAYPQQYGSAADYATMYGQQVLQ